MEEEIKKIEEAVRNEATVDYDLNDLKSKMKVGIDKLMVRAAILRLGMLRCREGLTFSNPTTDIVMEKTCRQLGFIPDTRDLRKLVTRTGTSSISDEVDDIEVQCNIVVDSFKERELGLPEYLCQNSDRKSEPVETVKTNNRETDVKGELTDKPLVEQD